jgi:hypothetical protein
LLDNNVDKNTANYSNDRSDKAGAYEFHSDQPELHESDISGHASSQSRNRTSVFASPSFSSNSKPFDLTFASESYQRFRVTEKALPARLRRSVSGIEETSTEHGFPRKWRQWRRVNRFFWQWRFAPSFSPIHASWQRCFTSTACQQRSPPSAAAAATTTAAAAAATLSDVKLQHRFDHQQLFKGRSRG